VVKRVPFLKRFLIELKISNKQARHTAIYCSGLDNTPSGVCNKASLIALVKYLGYVQLDPLQVVARAHDHILWSRNTNYRPHKLKSLLEKERLIFEHFSHDACVLPIESKLIARIADEGPLSSKDFKTPKPKAKRAIWTKSAHKQTLDYLWLTGVLAVSGREKFTKYYDVAERIYPQKLIDTTVSKQDRLTWLSMHALERLGIATAADIKQFWDATSLQETKKWCLQNSSNLTSISVESWDGSFADALTLGTNMSSLTSPPPLSKRIRIINPFDPIVRDRKRLLRLFNFDYRIEIYVPAEKRRFGYYVYPLLEYDKFIGRLEVRHDRSCNRICVDNLWHEQSVKFGKQRMEKLRSELERLRRFCGADSVQWSG